MMRFFSRYFVTKASDSESLCSTCSALNLKAILRNGCPAKDKIHLGRLTDILHKADQCRFCALIASLIRRRWGLDTLPNVDLSGVVCSLHTQSAGALANPDLQDRKRCHRFYIGASPRPLEVSDLLSRADMGLKLEIQLLEEDAYKVRRGRELHGRRMTDTVDMALVKRWLALCEHEHGDACASVWWRRGAAPLPRFVRMVDTASMSLVQAPLDCRYIALSYVWGAAGNSYSTTRANFDSRSLPAGIDLSVLPATIADAIHLVQMLGERYLWIDMLCIIQDNSQDKDEQIHAMDLVYGGALLTIFAASGESAHAKLPGVSPGSRTLHQQIDVIQGIHLALPLPSLRHTIRQTTWDTRGWTFQELLISRRRLFFTDHQVYFECAKDVWCEDLIAESKTLQYSDHPMRYSGSGANAFLYKLMFPDPDYMTSYVRLVERYTQRHLTYPSDVVLAITALTNTMARAYELAEGDPARAFRHGMQIWNFEQSLLWQPRLDSDHVRRVDDKGFSAWPSWAWAGWIGAVAYNTPHQFTTSIVSITTPPKPTESLVGGWYLVDDQHQLVCLDVERIWFGRIGNAPPPSVYVPPAGDVDARTLGELPPAGTLVFRTQCASLRVSRLALGDAASSAPHAIFDIVSDADLSMGRIILRSTTPLPSVLECVVVARGGNVIGLHDEVYGSYDGGLLHVIAVRRVGDAQVKERVGLGIVAEQAWLACGARVDTVFLR